MKKETQPVWVPHSALPHEPESAVIDSSLPLGRAFIISLFMPGFFLRFKETSFEILIIYLPGSSLGSLSFLLRPYVI